MRGNFSGIGVTGRIQQTASGPFVGTLNGIGSGFDGTIALSAQGKFQRAVIDAIALNAVLSGTQKTRHRAGHNERRHHPVRQPANHCGCAG
jgi:translocation and assembly module TamB